MTFDPTPSATSSPGSASGLTRCAGWGGVGWDDSRPVWTGSCPCQPFSAAGKQKGFDDERHLWPIWFNLIRECRPPVVLGEQVASGSGMSWLDLISADVEAEEYAIGAADLCAAGLGASHIRPRLYWVALDTADAIGSERRPESHRRPLGRVGWVEQPFSWDRSWQDALAEFRVLDDGAPRSVAATDAYRNALVAPVAQAFCGAVMDVILDAESVL